MTDEQQIPPPPETGPAHLSRAAPEDAALGRSLALVRFLRDNCPWDARQTPSTLRPYLLEEAHEVADAILSGDDSRLSRELGDLLLNVAFQIVLAEERGAFDARGVVGRLEEKMRERHPHVYGDEDHPPDWEELKARLRAEKARATDGGLDSPDPFEGIPAGLEPLSRALRMQDRAAALNFDWPDVQGALDKLREEIAELERSLGPASPEGEAPEDPTAVEEELGDLLFSVVNVCRLSEAHPSTALERAGQKFAARFRRLLELARRDGVDPSRASLADLDRLWEEAKSEEA